MFKNRLKQTGKFIFDNVIMPTLFVMVIATIGIFVILKMPALIDMALWGIGLFIGFLLLIGLIIFIHWLFIEPFKNRKKKNENPPGSQWS